MKKNPDESDELPVLAHATEDQPSKSRKKREALLAVELAKALQQLSPRKRDRFGLTAEINDALKHADDIRSNGAKKRQLQYIGKLLRSCADYEIYWQRYEKPQDSANAASDAANAATLEDTEDLQMRDRLLQNLAATMSDLRSRYPNANTQLIRQLVARIHKSAKRPQNDNHEQQAKWLNDLAIALREGRAD